MDYDRNRSDRDDIKELRRRLEARKAANAGDVPCKAGNGPDDIEELRRRLEARKARGDIPENRPASCPEHRVPDWRRLPTSVLAALLIVAVCAGVYCGASGRLWPRSVDAFAELTRAQQLAVLAGAPGLLQTHEEDGPEVREAEAWGPEVQELEAQEPEARAPEVQASEVPELEVQGPEVQEPEAQELEVQGPEVQGLKIQEPEVQKPEVQEPEVQKPEVQKPEAQKPEVQEPEAQKPEAQKPEAQQPEVQEPEAQEPEAQQPEIQEPDAPEARELVWIAMPGVSDGQEPVWIAVVANPQGGGVLEGATPEDRQADSLAVSVGPDGQ